MDPYPHTFTSKLKPVNCVEKDSVEFVIDTEAADAEVTWYNGNKKIVPDGTRIIEVAKGKQRKLIINDVSMKDSGDINCRTNKGSAINMDVKCYELQTIY